MGHTVPQAPYTEHQKIKEIRTKLQIHMFDQITHYVRDEFNTRKNIKNYWMMDTMTDADIANINGQE
jgi:hypothetical protein